MNKRYSAIMFDLDGTLLPMKTPPKGSALKNPHLQYASRTAEQ